MMMNYFAPKPAPGGFGFGPSYGERQAGWGRAPAPDPTVVNPVRPQAWSSEVAPMPALHSGGMTPASAGGYAPRALADVRFRRSKGHWMQGGWAGHGPQQTSAYDQSYGGLAGGYQSAGWGFGPRTQGWGGQAGGWSGFDRLVR